MAGSRAMMFSNDQLAAIAERIDPDTLPGDLPIFDGVIGTYKTLLLAHHLGGTYVYVRRWSDDESEWSEEIQHYVDLIGRDCTRDLMMHLNGLNTTCGAHIAIPKCEALLIEYRNTLIVNDHRPNYQLARIWRKSQSQIKRIKAKYRNAGSSQGILF